MFDELVLIVDKDLNTWGAKAGHQRDEARISMGLCDKHLVVSVLVVHVYVSRGAWQEFGGSESGQRGSLEPVVKVGFVLS